MLNGHLGGCGLGILIATGVKDTRNWELVYRFVSPVVSRKYMHLFIQELGKPRHSWGQNLKVPAQSKECIGKKLRVQLSVEIQVRGNQESRNGKANVGGIFPRAEGWAEV